MKSLLNILAILLISFVVLGCTETMPDADREIRMEESQMITDLQRKKNATVDEPLLSDFVPANMFARTMEEQDKGVHAYAYMLSPFSEKFFFVCEAAAFPYPGGTQFTAPEKQAYARFNTPHAAGWVSDVGVVPQADPNGLYTPATASATILPCWATEHDVNNTGNKFESTYFEDNLIVIPGPLPDELVINPDVPFVR